MKNNNEINNINENSFSDSKIKESTNSDTNKVLPIKSNETPWYKKKSSIIAMSSTLGAAVLTTAIAVPLAITSTQNTAELTKVVTVYDLTKKTAKLVVEGKNLPNDNTLYSVFRETKAKALTQIDTTITLNFISATEISLDFADISVAANTIYQVKLNNGTTSGNTITSISTENIDQPSFTISAQPSDVALSTNSGTALSATFTVTPSAVTNEISGQRLSYQWKTSDTNTTTDESKWTVIENETKATYTYDAKDLAINTKKYFKCIVSYKYANSVTSTIASVVITSQPTINVSAQTQSVDIPYSSGNSTQDISVTANVTNKTSGVSLTYQWKTADTADAATFNDIQGATSSSYQLTVVPGTKKYYKCTLTYTGAPTIESTVIYVTKAGQPIITIDAQPTTVNLDHLQTTASLTVNASLANSVASLTYQWQESETESGVYANVASNGNAKTYDLSNVAFGFSKYYKCIVSLTNAETKTSNAAHVTRVARPVVVIGTQPVASTNLTNLATTQLLVAATVTNSISGENLTYQWQVADTNAEANFTNISGATLTTYDLTNVPFGFSKYYRCKLNTTAAAEVTSDVAHVTRVVQPTFTITQPTAQTLTSSMNSFSLTATANVVHPIDGQNLSYQWKSSSTTENGTYVNIEGATNPTYTKQLDANTKNSWRDTWYKCEVKYTNAVTPTILSNSALVKMTLTQDEAKVELTKWLAVEDNAKHILTEFFNSTSETGKTSKNSFYSSLHEHHFPEGYPEVKVQSITPTPITVSDAYPTAYTSYTIKLVTLTETNMPRKLNGGNYNAETSKLPVATVIEFNTLFSFGSEAVEFVNTDTTKYSMLLAPTITSTSTSLVWTSTGIKPETNNPYKKGNYPVKFYLPSDLNTPAITDSILSPSRLQEINNTNYIFIPSYHII